MACGGFNFIGLACGAFCFIINLACGAFFSYKIFLNRGAFDMKYPILSANSSVVKTISTPTLSDHNDTVCTKQ